VVVDDGSTDNTREVLEAFGTDIDYVYKENGGLSAARNTGIEHSRGDYIAFLDADDLWVEGKIEKQLELFAKHPSVGVVYGNAVRITTEEKMPPAPNARQGTKAIDDFQNALLVKNVVTGSASCVLIKKECFDRLGGFDESLTSSEDWDMWLRISAQYEFAMVPDTLVGLRAHSQNMSKNVERMVRNHKRVIDHNLHLHVRGLRRAVLKHKAYGYMYYGNGLEYAGGDDRKERAHVIKSLLYYPLPTFYPGRYLSLIRTCIGSERYKKLRRTLKS